MSNTVIQLKFSTTSGNTPPELANGEIAINTEDGKFFYKSASGDIKSIQNFPGPSGLDGEIQFNDSGDLGSSANLTFDKANNQLTSEVVKSLSYFEFPDGTKQYTANGEGSIGATGATGPQGESFLNADGGVPNSIYGGISPIDGGSL